MNTMKKTLLILIVIFFAFQLHAQTLLIFGGKNHDVFLGCLNCGKYDSKSIWNAFGNFGSKFNDKCIWNKYSDYGGKYSDFSPFNQYANYPPVIVDDDGGFYGYFTVNKYNQQRCKSNLAIIICDYWEDIQDDVGKYYDKIFEQ